jgi:hypothetical protein
VGLSEGLDESAFDGCLRLRRPRTALSGSPASLIVVVGDIPTWSISRIGVIAPKRREEPLCTELASDETDRVGEISVERVASKRSQSTSEGEVVR